MISVVICSKNDSFLAQVKMSIQQTIGSEYELLVWDNKKVNRGICHVYNELASRAIFPIICFLHEDIIFRTSEWGSLLVNIFESDSNIGLVGVAGGKYKSSLCSGWYAGAEGLDFYNIWHEADGKVVSLSNKTVWKSREENVATIDGVFMACTKKVWQEITFDDTFLRGFHFYDIDFSLRVAQAKTVVVTSGIDMVHCTKGGDYGNVWVVTAIEFHGRMKHLLPYSVISADSSSFDYYVARYWLDWLKNYEISWSNKLLWINKQKLKGDKGLWYSIAKFLFYKPLRLQHIHGFFKKFL
jgi:hypothetical protein